MVASRVSSLTTGPRPGRRNRVAGTPRKGRARQGRASPGPIFEEADVGQGLAHDLGTVTVAKVTFCQALQGSCQWTHERKNQSGPWARSRWQKRGRRGDDWLKGALAPDSSSLGRAPVWKRHQEAGQRAPGHGPCVVAVWSLESPGAAQALLLPCQVITSHSAPPPPFSATTVSPSKASGHRQLDSVNLSSRAPGLSRAAQSASAVPDPHEPSQKARSRGTKISCTPGRLNVCPGSFTFVSLVPGAPHCLHLPLLNSHPSLKIKGWGGRPTWDYYLLCDPRQVF